LFAASIAPALNQERLLAMTREQLDQLFRASPAGPIPNGWGRGVAILAPGSPSSKNIAMAIELVGWQGKTFDAARGALLNRITPFQINAIAADVYAGPSVLDNRDCIVLDYSKTSNVARWIRDEIRLVAPDLYLGFAYVAGIQLIGFSLDFLRRSVGCSPPSLASQSDGGDA
jgi:hypothetical protein